MEEKNLEKSAHKNSPTGEFLQSRDWLKFQESVGRKTFHVEGENFLANIIEHNLPIAGKYFYIPKGPIFSGDMNHEKLNINNLMNLAKENKIGWIRVEPETKDILDVIKKSARCNVVKAPHDMQPKEIYVIDISKSEEELLAIMKSKTRYNIKLAEKKGVTIINAEEEKNNNYLDEFLRLTGIMAKRNGIVAHPESYYRKMLEIIPSDILKLYIARYQGKVIAANLVVFFESMCIYLHGSSDDEYRNVMAPYLLQWRQITDAKKAGFVKYDFGGVKINVLIGKSWEGVTKFKTGFSPKTKATIFPGSYDIIINRRRYWTYRILQKLKGIF
jgi:peptidoglycan pentaglycine glycine transferase (the first glycine)